MLIGGLIGVDGGSAPSTTTQTTVEVVPATIVLSFTTANGTSFLLPHNLGTEDFICQLYKTDIVPKELVLPLNITSSGPNHVLVELDIPMNGQVVLIKVV